MNTDQNIRASYCAELISRFGLSPQERFALGVSLICQCAEQVQNECPPEMDHPFREMTVDHANPFATAVAALEALDKWEGAARANTIAVANDELQRDAGRAEAADESPVAQE